VGHLDRLNELVGGLLGSARDRLEQLVGGARLRRPASLDEWAALLVLVGEVNHTISMLGQAAYGPDLDDLVWATGTRAWRRAQPRGLGFLTRRRLVRQARSLGPNVPAERAALHRALVRAQDQRERWSAAAVGDQAPSTVPGLEVTVAQFTRLRTELAALAATAAIPGLSTGSEEETERHLNELDDTRRELLGVPRINQLLDELTEYGLGPLLRELSLSVSWFTAPPTCCCRYTPAGPCPPWWSAERSRRSDCSTR
jgi:hypothetical protein